MRGWWIGVVLLGVVVAQVARAQEVDALQSGEAWREFAQRVGGAGDVVLQEAAPASPLDRAEGYRYLARLVVAGIDKAIERADPNDPRLRWSAETWGLPNSDALYTTVPLRGDAVYRVSGRRGSVHWLNLQVTAGWFDSETPMRVVSQVAADELEIDDDGRFSMVLGGAEQEGNWLPFAPDVSLLTVRQFFYDWDNETRAELQIERLGDGPRPRVAAPAQLAEQLQAAAAFVENTATLFTKRALAARASATNMFVEPFRASDQLGIKRNVYTSGHFVLGPEEALIIEVHPPRCFYWGLQLGNFWMEPLDFANHQTSLNGHQAVLDPDGVFRAVVSERDPGVANWLDTTGHSEGAMLIRWLQCDAAPRPTTRRVAFGELSAALPESTPRVTPEQRAETLAKRRAHVARRYR